MFNILRVATFAGGLAVAAVALAGPATASELGYIKRLEKAQVAHMSNGDALHWGYAACDDLRNGTPVPSTISMLRDAAGFTNRDAGTIIGAATTELCPDQYQAAMGWAHGQAG